MSANRIHLTPLLPAGAGYRGSTPQLRPGTTAVAARLWCVLVLALASTAVVLVCVSPGVAGATACDGGVDLIVARGTQEPGWLGAAVGDSLYRTLQDSSPVPMTAYRVDYPADLSNPMSVGLGSADLVRHILGQAAACPQQRFIIAGYSQGAVVVHSALGTAVTGLIPATVQLPATVGDRIVAVLLFGDPLRLLGVTVPGTYLARTGSWCTEGDPICQPGGDRPPAHIAYGDTLASAARFTVDRL